MTEEVLAILRNGNRLRGVLKELSLGELKDIQDRLERLISLREEDELKRRQAFEEKEAAVKDALAVLKEKGLGAEDLISYFGGEMVVETPKRKRAPRPAKYQWFEDGQTKQWTGQGRKPLFLQRQEAAGKNIDEFLIK